MKTSPFTNYTFADWLLHTDEQGQQESDTSNSDVDDFVGGMVNSIMIERSSSIPRRMQNKKSQLLAPATSQGKDERDRKSVV